MIDLEIEGDETPWGLTDRETVCGTCRLAFLKALGKCPTCEAEGRTPATKVTLCAPSACGSCPLAGLCGDPADLPPEPVTYANGDAALAALLAEGARSLGIPSDEVDVDPAEPRPEGGCCGGGCG